MDHIRRDFVVCLFLLFAAPVYTRILKQPQRAEKNPKEDISVDCPSFCKCTELLKEQNTEVASTKQKRWSVICENAKIVCVKNRDTTCFGRTISLIKIPENTVELSLKGNNIQKLSDSSFRFSLKNLEKLDVSDNKLHVISGRAFQPLKNLRFLNLTSNNLKAVNKSLLLGLKKLERLDFANNPLPSFPHRAFKDLDSLKFLEIGSDQLTCDCNTRGLRKLIRKRDIRLSPQSYCRFPKALRGKLLSKVKKSQLRCPETLDPKLFDIDPPDTVRLMFPGDHLLLRCRLAQEKGTSQDPITIEWLHKNRPIDENDRIRMSTTRVMNASGILTSNLSLNIREVRLEDAGGWKCRAESPDKGPIERSFQLMVMSGNMQTSLPTPTKQIQGKDKKCPKQTVETKERGTFIWPESSAGTVSISCPHDSCDAIPCFRSMAFVSRRCLPSGKWMGGSRNESMCTPLTPIIKRLREEIISPEEGKDELPRRLKWEILANVTGELINSTDYEEPNRFLFELESVVEGIETVDQTATISGASDKLAALTRAINMVASVNSTKEELKERKKTLAEKLRKIVGSFQQIDEYNPYLVHDESEISGFNPIGFCKASSGPQDREPLGMGMYLVDGNRENPSLSCMSLDEKYKVSTPDFSVSVFVPQDLTRKIIQPPETSINGFVKKQKKPLYVKTRFFWTKSGNGLFDASPKSDWIAENHVVGISVEDLLGAMNFGPIFKQTHRTSRKKRSSDLPKEEALDPAESKRLAFGLTSSTETPNAKSERDPSNDMMQLSFALKSLSETVRLGFWKETTSSWEAVENSGAFSKGQNCSQKIFTETGEIGKDATISFSCPSDPMVKLIAGTYAQKPPMDSPAFIYFSPLQIGQELLVLRQPVIPISLLPWMLGGTGCLSFCLLCSIFAYSCRRASAAVRISVKLRHCLLNIWIAIILLSLLFTLGVDQTDSSLDGLCLAVSVGLHYLSLVVLFWMMVTARTIQRKLWKIAHPRQRKEGDDDRLPSSQLPKHGSLAGLYFISWGIPSLLVAFTLALKMEDYARLKTCCFIYPGYAALGSLAIPAAIVIFTTLILIMNSGCLEKMLDRKKMAQQQKKGNGILPTLDDWDDSSELPFQERSLTAQPNHSGLSAVPLITRIPEADEGSTVVSAQSSVLDHSLQTPYHLKWLSVVLFLSILSYAAAFAYVARPEFLTSWIPYFDQILSGIYAAFVSLLGFCVVFGYVGSRPEITCCGKGGTKSEKNHAESLIMTNGAIRSPNGHHHHHQPNKAHRRSVGVGVVSGGPDYIRASDSRFNMPEVSGEAVPEEALVFNDSSLLANGSEFFLPPEKQRRMLHIAKKYHSNQRKMQQENGNDIYEGLQSEVIMEEDEDQTSRRNSKRDSSRSSSARNRSSRGENQQQIHPSVRLYSQNVPLVASFCSDPGSNRKMRSHRRKNQQRESSKHFHGADSSAPESECFYATQCRASSHSPLPTQDIFDDNYVMTTISKSEHNGYTDLEPLPNHKLPNGHIRMKRKGHYSDESTVAAEVNSIGTENGTQKSETVV